MKDPNKPRKIIYPTKKQKEILSNIRKIIKPISKDKHVEKVLICGSLAHIKLGKYVREYHGMKYSDIDILVIANGKVKIPHSFKVGPRLPEKIMKNIRKMFYRYSSRRKIDNKFQIHLHVFNRKIHNSKLASRFGWPVSSSVKKYKALLIYEKSRRF